MLTDTDGVAEDKARAWQAQSICSPPWSCNHRLQIQREAVICGSRCPGLDHHARQIGLLGCPSDNPITAMIATFILEFVYVRAYFGSLRFLSSGAASLLADTQLDFDIESQNCCAPKASSNSWFLHCFAQPLEFRKLHDFIRPFPTTVLDTTSPKFSTGR